MSIRDIYESVLIGVNRCQKIHKSLQKFSKMHKTAQIRIRKKQILVFIRVHSWFQMKKQSQFQTERSSQTHALKRLPRPSGPRNDIDNSAPSCLCGFVAQLKKQTQLPALGWKSEARNSKSETATRFVEG